MSAILLTSLSVASTSYAGGVPTIDRGLANKSSGVTEIAIAPRGKPPTLPKGHKLVFKVHRAKKGGKTGGGGTTGIDIVPRGKPPTLPKGHTLVFKVNRAKKGRRIETGRRVNEGTGKRDTVPGRRTTIKPAWQPKERSVGGRKRTTAPRKTGRRSARRKACGSRGSRKNRNITGTYTSGLKLRQTGRIVTGTYENGKGTIRGTLRGNRLVGTFVRSDYSPPIKGRFEFRFSKDRKSFTGSWRNTSIAGSGTWNGRRIGQVAEKTRTCPKLPARNKTKRTTETARAAGCHFSKPRIVGRGKLGFAGFPKDFPHPPGLKTGWTFTTAKGTLYVLGISGGRLSTVRFVKKALPARGWRIVRTKTSRNPGAKAAAVHIFFRKRDYCGWVTITTGTPLPTSMNVFFKKRPARLGGG